MAQLTKQTHIDTEVLKRERPLADVIASYGVALRREGQGTFRGLCPFHQEHTPSFWVDVRDPANEHYFCFGACGTHGDVITFVMEREACSFAEGCEQLGARGKPTPLEPSARSSPHAIGPQWESMQPDSAEAEVLNMALQVYEDQLWRSPRARAYLRSRGIPELVARSQRLGYADGRTLVDHLVGASPRAAASEDSLATAVRIGLVVERPAGNDVALLRKEFFVDRVVVPELRGGRPIWCIGRALEDPPAVSAAQTDPGRTVSLKPRPKYLGLPGEKPLIGLENVIGRRFAFLVEGPLDWLAAVGWGLPAFAICGTHFPMDRVPALADAVAVYGLFDPDRAGLSTGFRKFVALSASSEARRLNAGHGACNFRNPVLSAAERFAPIFGSRWRPVRLPNSLDLAELAALGEWGRETFRLLIGRARAAAWQDGRL